MKAHKKFEFNGNVEKSEINNLVQVRGLLHIGGCRAYTENIQSILWEYTSALVYTHTHTHTSESLQLTLQPAIW